MNARLLALVMLAALGLGGPAARGDTYVVTLDPRAEPVDGPGRLVLFVITEQGRRWENAFPIRGPFWSPPQPIFSVPVDAIAPGEQIEIPGTVRGFPQRLDDLEGTVRVQAVLDVDRTERSHLAGPANRMSDVVRVELLAGGDERVELRLDWPLELQADPQNTEGLAWVRVRSELLSGFAGRAIEHRCGVALPPDYHDPARADERWPVVYVIPGYGGRDSGARRYAMMYANEAVASMLPRAVFVVLDPESPLGHHGFVDSPNHGPRGTALVTELIPHLERTFRLRATPEARVLTGHSSGGWSSLWLQLRWSDVFGACWSSAPDPVDFRAFQQTNLYESDNLYVDDAGDDIGSLRGGADGDVVMTVREEGMMEWAVHPDGGSGEQWDAWEAMFSPPDPATGYPRPMFDALTGAIDPETVEAWRAFDVSRIVREDWPRYGSIVTERVRLHCGEVDSFYLDNAVRLFKTEVETLAAENGGWNGPGYVRLVPDADHDSLMPVIRKRMYTEMREHFERLAE